MIGGPEFNARRFFRTAEFWQNREIWKAANAAELTFFGGMAKLRVDFRDCQRFGRRPAAIRRIFRVVEQDASVLDRIAAAQRAELEEEIADLNASAEILGAEAEELFGRVPF